MNQDIINALAQQQAAQAQGMPPQQQLNPLQQLPPPPQQPAQPNIGQQMLSRILQQQMAQQQSNVIQGGNGYPMDGGQF